MFCNICHTDIGDQIGLCPTCRSKRDVEKGGELVGLKERIEKKQKFFAKRNAICSDNFPLSVVTNPVQFLSYLAATMIFFTPLFFFVLLPKPNLGAAVLLAISSSAFLLSLSMWAVMWIELTFANPVMCIFSLLVPISVHALVIAHPERTRKPFVFHLFFATLGVAALISIYPLTKISGVGFVTKLFSINTGFFHEQNAHYEVKDGTKGDENEADKPIQESPEQRLYGTKDNPIRAPRE